MSMCSDDISKLIKKYLNVCVCVCARARERARVRERVLESSD